MPAMSAESPATRIVRPSGPATSEISSCWRFERSDFAAARIASGDALWSSSAATARSPRRRSRTVAPGFAGCFAGSKPSISAMKRSASSIDPRSPTIVTRSASGSATTVGFLSAGYAAKSCSSRSFATGAFTFATENVFMPRPPAAVGSAPPATGTSSRSIVCFSWSIFAREPRATMAFVRSSAATTRPATRFSSIFVRFPSAGFTTYSTTRSPMSACRLLRRSAARACRIGRNSMRFSTSLRSISSMIRWRRRTCAAVSTSRMLFCCSSAVTDPYVATRFLSCSATGFACALRSGSTTVTTVSSVTCVGTVPTKVGTFSRFMSSSFCRNIRPPSTRSMQPCVWRRTFSVWIASSSV
ncbi:MAG: hypothetical protein LW806_03200 [Planctomycetaceae bacterium]|nr:hypothetical protein [Planctomycetaceae bacterium]